MVIKFSFLLIVIELVQIYFNKGFNSYFPVKCFILSQDDLLSFHSYKHALELML